ncbi:SDR family oxidoreductase [Amylibacter sp. SFDW26]|uniref:SDR family oxidoreductase n=1 Tax=Amylibacter sp. SFDW26 TaxID=2652722 RepID=UPI001262028B|nr:SDR family oxidoreductase [Amylibacter sp. SFDW26]KAB7613271.1 SDR family oxidoreductase [Amylibacter sp. SFDW26]
MELKNKTIIITGASSGIGEAAALLFAQEGANLIIGARREAELERVATLIGKDSVKTLAGDVKDLDYAQALVELAVGSFGGLNGAFNNAGLMGDTVDISTMSLDNWNDVMATNLTSAFLLARTQVPALKAQGGGSIVFTSSFVGVTNGGMPGMAAYAASKAGLNGFVQSIASEYAADGVRVTSLMPGGTVTAMAGDDPEVHSFISNLHPMKRMADPKEIAQLAMFLLSDRASFVTGSAIAADGGMSVRLL